MSFGFLDLADDVMYAYAYVGIKIQYTILFVQNTVFKIYLDLNPNIGICMHFHKYVIDIK